MVVLGELGLTGIVLLAIWIYALVDVISTPDGATRNLPKMAWVLIVLLLPDLGAIAWLLLGRPNNKGALIGDRPHGYLPATDREQTNQSLARSADLNDRLDAWEREQAEERRIQEEGRVAEADLARREVEVARRENDAKARDLAAWERRLTEKERSSESPSEGPNPDSSV